MKCISEWKQSRFCEQRCISIGKRGDANSLEDRDPNLKSCEVPIINLFHRLDDPIGLISSLHWLACIRPVKYSSPMCALRMPRKWESENEMREFGFGFGFGFPHWSAESKSLNKHSGWITRLSPFQILDTLLFQMPMTGEPSRCYQTLIGFLLGFETLYVSHNTSIPCSLY